MPPRKTQQGGRGVALGVLGLMMLSFVAVIFLLGKHQHHEHPEISVHPAHTQPGGKDAATGTQQKTVGSTPATVVKTDDETVSTEASPPPPSPSPPPKKADTKQTVLVTQPVTGTPGVGVGLTDLDKAYKPTREMVQKIAQDGYLLVTWANWHYQDFVRTWIMHVKKVGITGYIVGAMDEHLLQVLADQKLNVFSMKSGLTLGDFGWGSKTFAKMGREKIKLIRVFLELGVYVIISDVDVLWLRNPIPYFKQFPEADVLTSSDHLSNTVPDEALEKWLMAGSAANIGIMLFRNKSMEFVNKWIDIIEKDDNVWDQNAFNDLFRQGAVDIPGSTQHLFKGYYGKLTMGILPVSVFCSGHTFFTQQLWKKLKLEPYALHATFQFSGTNGKRHRMREFMLFDDVPEYYEHKTGFLGFKMDGIDALLPKAGPADGQSKLSNVQGHFLLVNHQIQRIRTAMAMATVLGRALIVPQLWCGQDRWWAPHSGTIPGSSFELPFQCPMDHVFDLEGGLGRDLPADTYGPNIEYKESTFLNNSKLPEATRTSRVTVEICAVGDAECSDGTAPAPVKGGKVRVQAGLLSEQLRVALREAQPYKVLEFTTMNNAFKNFTSAGDWQKFFNRIKGIGSIWCCVNAHPGHVHYDPWFDIPHIDKFNKQWDKWEPTTGP